ncbi:hypothetical protein FH593_20405 (plasmid) [Leptospira interrogans]|uniref:hypothetical protein n=1 Tax=Leptospira interrogans TaxID=173 RepID=UPI0002BF0B87|nr:hypothetical protein [Leptospira interrogans]EMN60301.1 hypothetical protein LEP1GSC092_0038 [Leptospira interrogans serovar Pyrogenes str. R168]ULG90664.1 hypothetical protein FH593_20700 [Leptospira interrogans]ULG90693.1 hypothetical protein FH593_20405 [Leptospira interrogans]UML78407.1 hypothetical protein FH583_21690 [Leptospira interrogans]UML78463.1 hypothetical protein FH583_21540 [Leptospira interrogans]
MKKNNTKEKKPGKKPGKSKQVGKNNPPIETQFQPGNDGHGGGRKPGTLNWKTVVSKIGNAPIPDGYIKQLQKKGWIIPDRASWQEALVLGMFYAGSAGDSRCALFISNHSGGNLTEAVDLLNKLNLEKLSETQLKRILNGEDPIQVLIGDFLNTQNSA